MNAALAVATAVAASSSVLQAPAPPVAISAEMTAALLLATAGAIALFWFSVKMVAGFREYRQVTAEREEGTTGTAEGDNDSDSGTDRSA